MNSFGIAQALHSWHSGLVIGIMAAMSVYLVALIVVRLKFFMSIQTDSQKLLKEAREALLQNDPKALAGIRGQRAADPPVRILISAGFSHPDLPPAELSELLAVTRMRQAERLQRGLSTFGTMAAVAPFIGLLGTVIGIVESFNSLAASGAAGPNVVAAGVAMALWATAAGLVVAIPSVVAYNVFRSKAKVIMTDMEVVSREIVALFRIDSLVKRLKVAA
ncbi:MAG: MotA/TolQ/ExbB proton channel family protein [Elusimicrobia bacterium]|nr:MotA/TolQ/ExbB proton channel family protein [Elusimicrobiota bacterium]